MTGPHARQPRSLPAGLAKPAQRALAAAGYTTLEQLTQVTEADLARMHGIGTKAIAQLRDALAAAGLSFAAKNLTRLRRSAPEPPRGTPAHRAV